MEYLYIVGIVGYYIYKAYSNNKKKQQEKAEAIPSAQENSKQKKKKGFFDDFLEELEKQQTHPKPSTTKAAPVNRDQTINKRDETITSREQTIVARKDISTKKVQKKPVPAIADKHVKPLNKYFEMPSNDLDLEVANTDIQTLLEVSNQPKSKRKFAGMDISPKEALKAQIILNKRF